MNKNKIIISLIVIVFAAILIGGGFLLYSNRNKNEESQQSLLSAQEVGEKAVKFFNENILEQGITASLVDAAEENDLYKIHLKIENTEYGFYVTKDGKLLFTNSIDLENPINAASQSQETLGNFLVSEDEVCSENGKPVVYFFGSNSCPHCQWEHPIVEKVAKKFEGYISFHNNMDSEADSEIFQKYSSGGIPTLIIGCKYYREGSGEADGEEKETQTLTALICKLTNNQPAEICNQVQGLIEEIP